ncbi:MAG: hypothetical protein IKN72_03375 [Clostridia bacterium]|nr:hypothetical protein [Clostridia bacterium]MBR3552411.1 hypothetical protein [Clostridia bacterium]
MSGLSLWVRTLALVTIFCAVLSALLPEGKMKGAFGYLCGVFLICAALQGFPGEGVLRSAARGLFQTDPAAQASLSDVRNQPALWAAQTALETQLADAFTAQGLPFTAAVLCTGDTEESIAIQVTVRGRGTEAQTEQAHALLASLLPADAAVTWETEEQP